MRLFAVTDTLDLDSIAEVPEKDAVVLGAKPEQRRVDGLQPFDIALAGF